MKCQAGAFASQCRLLATAFRRQLEPFPRESGGWTAAVARTTGWCTEIDIGAIRGGTGAVASEGVAAADGAGTDHSRENELPV
jgi:hypothetical protein